APVQYDSGDYPRCLGRAAEMIGYADWRAQQETYRAAGRDLGLGVACYGEGTGIGPHEGWRGPGEHSGKAFARAGGGAEGQRPLGEVAAAANPLRFAMPREWESPGLEATRYFAPPRGTFSNGVHACIVEIDPETGALSLHRYVIVHDCGRVLNPLIVEGQIHG